METEIDLTKRWVNQGTGEIRDDVEEIIDGGTRKKKHNQSRGYDYYKNNILPLPTLLQQEYGNFIHSRYQALLDKVNNDTATAFRFIYLCTYMDYDTGYIIWKNRKVKNDNLIDVFNVSKNTMTKIKNTLYEYELIKSDSDGYVFINTEYCYRGDINQNKLYKKQCTRIFNNSIQELYNKSNDSREHKLLGKFILLLPYINVWHNVICLTPKEKDMGKIVFPNSSQMDQILGVGSRNSNRTLNELFNITVGGEKAILMVTDTKSIKMYLVNPRIYYGGTNVEGLQETMEYFKARGGID